MVLDPTAGGAKRAPGETEAGAAALLACESFLDQLFARSNLIVALRDTEGRFLRVSRRLGRMFVTLGVDAIGKTVFDVLPARMASRIHAHDTAVLESGRPGEYEEEFAVGSVRRAYHTSLLPLLDGDGRVGALFSITTDITARRRNEEALRNAALAVSGARRSGVFDQLVRYLAETLTVDFAFITRLNERRPGFSTIVSGYLRGQLVHDIEYALAGTPCENVFEKSFEFVPRELPARFPADAMMIEQRLVSYAAYPLYDADGAPLGLIGVAHGKPLVNRQVVESMLRIYSFRAASELERQQAEQELRISEANYREIFENAEDAILVHDPETGAVLDANPKACLAFGRSLAELRRTDFGVFAFADPPFPREEAARLIERARHGEKVRVVTRRRDGEGMVRWDEVVISRAVLAGKHRILVFVREITESKDAEDALRASEEQYRAIFNASVNGVTLWDAEGRLVDVNPAACAMYGYTRDEMLSLNLETIVHPDERHALGAFIAQVRSGEPFRLEARNQRRDGTVFEVEVDAVPMEYRGRPHMLGFFRDVTERKQREAALRASEAQYRAIFDASADGMILFDDTATIVDVNPALVAMYGYSREELLKLDPHARFHPDSWPVLDRFLERLRSGWFFEPEHEGTTLIEETRERTRDGRLLDLEAHLVSMRYQGRPHVLAIKRDITERKQREAALAKSEDRLRATVEAALDCIIVIDADGRIIEFNPAAESCFGLSREAVIGANLAEQIIPPAHRRGHELGMGHYRRTGEGAFLGRRIEVTAMRADGGEFPAELAIAAVKGPDGDIFVGYLRDISDRRQAESERSRLESQLLQAQKMEAIGHLTGGIAHDFNNMLTSILGYTTMALDGVDQLPPARLQKYLGQVRASGERARDLIRQMLTFSRGQRGEPRPLSLPQVVEEAIGLFRSSFPSSITFEIDAARSVPAVMSDPIQIEQVLMNLCINARDAMAGSGRIRVDIRRGSHRDAVCASCRQDVDGDYVELTVTDTGPGIEPQVMESMFEPFYTTKEVGQGSGMGLSTTHGIVHEHGGHILVRNNENGGARFTILLPAVDPGTAVSTTADRAQDASLGEQMSGRALVVDDEPAVREFVSDLLESRGMMVCSASGGAGALEQLEQGRPFDVVITDQTMPGLSGTELARHVRTMRPGLPVILVTGFSDSVTGRSPAELGVDDVFTKPLDHVALLARVRELVRMS